jgi:RNA polymerase sigma factor (sigma-70 family)
MMETKPYLPWPGADERSVVEGMLRDRGSKHWEECSNFVKRCVYVKAKNIPSNLQEDIIQEVMYKVTKYLPDFRFQCALKTWLNQITESCIIDLYRRLRNERPHQSILISPSNQSDREDEELNVSEVRSAEEAFEINNIIRNGISALLEYTNTHSNQIRNRRIIKMIIFEGQTHAEAAKAVGCNAPVVSYVVREAQRYAREKMVHGL